jgi:hypothetical protein
MIAFFNLSSTSLFSTFLYVVLAGLVFFIIGALVIISIQDRTKERELAEKERNRVTYLRVSQLMVVLKDKVILSENATVPMDLIVLAIEELNLVPAKWDQAVYDEHLPTFNDGKEVYYLGSWIQASDWGLCSCASIRLHWGSPHVSDLKYVKFDKTIEQNAIFAFVPPDSDYAGTLPQRPLAHH